MKQEFLDFVKITLVRLSSMPSLATRSYTYAVVGELPDDVDGIYDSTNGQKLLYSRVRLGNLNKEVTVPCRVVAESKDRTLTGRHFINLIDPTIEKLSEELAAKAGVVNAASRFFGNMDASVDLGSGIVIKLGATPAVEKAAAVPAKAPAIKDAVKTEDPEQHD